MYKAENGSYPSSLDSNNCPTAPVSSTNRCLITSDGNTLSYTGDSDSYSLSVTDTSSLTYMINQDGIISAPADSFINAWGGVGTDKGYSLIQTSDGGYAVTGFTGSFGTSSYYMFLIKYNSNGELSWSKTWGGTGDDQGFSIVQTSDSGYAVTGYTSSFGAGSNDMFLAKYTLDGTIDNCSSPMCQSYDVTTAADINLASITVTSDNAAIIVNSPPNTANTVIIAPSI